MRHSKVRNLLSTFRCGHWKWKYLKVGWVFLVWIISRVCVTLKSTVLHRPHPNDFRVTNSREIIQTRNPPWLFLKVVLGVCVTLKSRIFVHIWMWTMWSRRCAISIVRIQIRSEILDFKKEMEQPSSTSKYPTPPSRCSISIVHIQM